jgi:hypothetical protein
MSSNSRANAASRTSPEKAAASEEAGVDLMGCRFDTVLEFLEIPLS